MRERVETERVERERVERENGGLWIRAPPPPSAMGSLEQRKKRMGLSTLVVGAAEASSSVSSPLDKLTESGRFVIGDFIIARDGVVEEVAERPRVGRAYSADFDPTGALSALAMAHSDSDLVNAQGAATKPHGRSSSERSEPSSLASRLTAAGPGGEPLDWSQLTIGEMLGRGASGYVRRARLGKQELAIKRIAISDEERRRQTFNEITALVGCADLGAANLVTCYGGRPVSPRAKSRVVCWHNADH